MNEKEAFIDGKEHGLIDCYNNPYNLTNVPDLWQAWEDGYDEGQKLFWRSEIPLAS